MSLLTSVIHNIFRARKEASQLPDEEASKKFIEDELNRHNAIVNTALPGPRYYEWLMWFQYFVKPKVYLEIGVETGKALAYAMPPTLAIGVDPSFQISFEFKARTKLFKQTSDAFFDELNPTETFEDQKIDMAFIDGLHTFDQALKDFINVEKHSHHNTIILFHDVLPIIPETADRDRHTMFWIGDTWKVMFILKKYRPDIKLFTIPTSSSGLGVTAQLDPNSTVLTDRYDEIVKEAMAWDLKEFMPNLRENINTLSNDFNLVAETLNS